MQQPLSLQLLLPLLFLGPVVLTEPRRFPVVVQVRIITDFGHGIPLSPE